MSQCNYKEQELPSPETIRQKLNQLGYYPQPVAKTQPQSKLTPYGIFLPELDELFMYFTESRVTADFILTG